MPRNTNLRALHRQVIPEYNHVPGESYTRCKYYKVVPELDRVTEKSLTKYKRILQNGQPVQLTMY